MKLNAAAPPTCRRGPEGPESGLAPEAIMVEISDTQRHLPIDRPWVEGLVRRVLMAEGIGGATISVALVDNAAIHEVNRRHLGHDWPTDVISFPLGEPGDPLLSGELIVSAEMAAETAREAGLDPRDELALYLVHGLLHLCGHDDLNDEDAVLMRAREAEQLAREGITNTFAMVGPSAKADADRAVRGGGSWSA